MKIEKQKINIITLGCSKNLVDSEQLMAQLINNNCEIVHNSNSLDYKTVVINTCGFINDAKQESIDTILQFSKAKERGELENLFVMGCLSERFKEDLKKAIPEVNKYFGVNDLEQILQILKANNKNKSLTERYLTTPNHFAYLKIAEGCDRTCSFCAIPLIRGSHKSKSIEVIIEEAKLLTKQGVKEIILISQELTYYGVDLYKRQALKSLLEGLIDIEGIEWIRLQYTYPSKFPMEMIEFMRDNVKICNYLDIPFQHISDKMLHLMRRGINKKETYQLIAEIREINPAISLRTTLIVGHPGETDDDFNELVEFVNEMKFDRLGVFEYSHEEGTHSYNNFKDDIESQTKQDRLNHIMNIQKDISHKLNDNKIGKILNVIIDRQEGENFIGRTEHDSPEVDGEIIINKYPKHTKIGNFYNVRITNADEYDLTGEIKIK